jgi:hypothetical protein
MCIATIVCPTGRTAAPPVKLKRMPMTQRVPGGFAFPSRRLHLLPQAIERVVVPSS